MKTYKKKTIKKGGEGPYEKPSYTSHRRNRGTLVLRNLFSKKDATIHMGDDERTQVSLRRTVKPKSKSKSKSKSTTRKGIFGMIRGLFTNRSRKVLPTLNLKAPPTPQPPSQFENPLRRNKSSKSPIFDKI